MPFDLLFKMYENENVENKLIISEYNNLTDSYG